MKKLILFSVFLFCNSAFSLDLEFFNTKQRQIEEFDLVVKNIPNTSTLILGEEHYNPLVHEAQGLIVEGVVKSKNASEAFTGAWEFLDYPDQTHITEAFKKWKGESINDRQFLAEIFGSVQRGDNHHVYLPFLRAIKNLGGQLLATNAPRKWKKIITDSGLLSLDPKLVPPNMKLGSSHYFDRFKEVMQDHVPPEKLQNYFEAQSYTDSVMGHKLMTESSFDLKFMVVGSFHSDYSDGLVENYKMLSSSQVIVFKLVDASKLSADELDALFKDHPQYGPVADYIVLIRSRRE
jgi:uncharacterized iron-regulated protein